jgi:hypothetical protein
MVSGFGCPSFAFKASAGKQVSELAELKPGIERIKPIETKKGRPGCRAA